MLIATAGHVDHGKTILIKALTGVDTDRLPEEKARGLTIDLGFAYQSSASGRRLGFVDVPGHERFIRNMVAGVGAIDFAMLIVAADDGPMPQTREHLAILDLMGLKAGALIITKIDRSTPERVAEVELAAREMVAGSSLSDVPVFCVSAQEGTGVPQLRTHLENTAELIAAPATHGSFRLAVDRSFTVPGAGIVVTGAVFSGEVKVGDRLRLRPGDASARVRSIHAQGEDADVGRTGHRCALNVAGPDLSVENLFRGQWLVGADGGEASTRIDVRLKILVSEEREFGHWTPVHVHMGAGSSTGRVALLGERRLSPGHTGLAQLVTERPLLGVHGDRFVLRDQSARRTIGGGQVIDPFPPLRRRGRDKRIAVLAALEQLDIIAALTNALASDRDGLDLDLFCQARNLTAQEAGALREAVAHHIVTQRGARIAYAAQAWRDVRSEVLKNLADWHQQHPDEVGPELTRLRQGLPDGTPVALSDAALESLLSGGEVVREGVLLRTSGHQPSLPPADARLLDRVRRELGPGDLQPPVVHALAEHLTIQKPALEAFLVRCVRRGQFVRVSDNRFLHPDAVSRLVATVLDLSEAGQRRFTAKEFRDVSGIGRNFTIQLLEYLDSQGVTRRIGDERAVVLDRARAY